MPTRIPSAFLRAGWKFPCISALSSRRPVVLLYHGVSREHDPDSISVSIFSKHLDFLNEHFEIIDPGRLFERRKRGDKIRVLLTFDDGFGNHTEVLAPVLAKKCTPALFFVSSGHSKPGKYLWFSYLRAFKRYLPSNVFKFRGKSFDMTGPRRERTLSRLTDLLLSLRPHPSAMYEAIENEFPPLEEFVPQAQLAEFYAGMTSGQVVKLASNPLFHIGAHTVSHPFLSRCEPDVSLGELKDNKAWLEEITGRRCDSVAYPSGDYDARIMDQCRDLGFLYGFSVDPVVNRVPDFELPRVGIYNESEDILGFKVQWGNLMRSLKIKIG